MKTKQFLSHVQHERVHHAIRDAEIGTSGDIVLSISHRRIDDPLAAAEKEFARLRLQNAKDKNSLLFFVAPESQKFAVIGGTALHDKIGQAGWNHLITLLERHFKEQRFSDGLVAAIEHAGMELRRHFPADRVDRTDQQDIVEQ